MKFVVFGLFISPINQIGDNVLTFVSLDFFFIPVCPYSWLFYCPFYSGYYCFRFFGVAQLAVFACVHLVVNGKDVTETSFAEILIDLIIP